MIGLILSLVFLLLTTLIIILICKKVEDTDSAFTAGILVGLVGAFLTLGSFIDSCVGMNMETEYKENVYTQKSIINVSAANLLKSADSILTFVDDKTEVYKEIMESITAARTGNGSVERVYKIIHENYPADMEMGKQWQSYIDSIDSAYTSILNAQVSYNEAVREYRSLFTPLKRIFLGHGPDESIQYFSLDYEINYTLKN